MQTAMQPMQNTIQPMQNAMQPMQNAMQANGSSNKNVSSLKDRASGMFSRAMGDNSGMFSDTAKYAAKQLAEKHLGKEYTEKLSNAFHTVSNIKDMKGLQNFVTNDVQKLAIDTLDVAKKNDAHIQKFVDAHKDAVVGTVHAVGAVGSAGDTVGKFLTGRSGVERKHP